MVSFLFGVNLANQQLVDTEILPHHGLKAFFRAFFGKNGPFPLGDNLLKEKDLIKTLLGVVKYVDFTLNLRNVL